MLKLKDKSIRAYKGDYRPVELIKNTKKIHGYKKMDMKGESAVFENTYNDFLTIYGRSILCGGSNLLPSSATRNGECVDYNNNVREWQITLLNNGYFDFSGCLAEDVLLTATTLKAGIYTASGCEKAKIKIGDLETLNFPATFEIAEETKVWIYLFNTDDSDVFLKNQYVQINKGTRAKEFSKFVGNGDFPPSLGNPLFVVPAEGTVRSEGGNLLPQNFNNPSIWETTVSADGSKKQILKMNLKPGKYVLSFDSIPHNTYIFLYFQQIDSSGTSTTIAHPLMNEAVNNITTFEVVEGYEYRFWSWRLMENFRFFSNWQLRRSDTPNKFYPPENPTEISDLSLNGIEVSMNDKYNYFEVSKGKGRYYIADAIEGDKCIRRIGTIILNGENAVELVQTSGIYNVFSVDLSEVVNEIRFYSPILCNCFIPLTPEDGIKEGAYFGRGDKKLYLVFNKSRFTSAEHVKTWFENRCNLGKPIQICYLLDAEVIEESEPEKILKSYPEFTRIFVESKNPLNPLVTTKIIKVQN